MKTVGIVFLLALATPQAVDAGDNRPPVARISSATDLSVLEVYCSATSAPTIRPVRATCKVTQTTILPPSTSHDEKPEIGNLARKMNQKEFTKACSSMRLDGRAPTLEHDLADTMKIACAKGDISTYADAIAAYYKIRSEKTCRIDTTVNEYEFVQQDANTWIHTGGPGGICAVSLTITLWREKDAPSWNFRQVRSAPPNGTGLCENLGKLQTVVEFSWSDSGLRVLPCTHIEM